MQKLLILTVIATLSLTARPNELSAQSRTQPNPTAQESQPQAVLVELFTSEGCSSCPPADALLSSINGKRTASGQLVVGISEHVTYWNQLGWSDPFSSPTYTERQNDYATRFGLGSVYTPQMVINGEEQIVGSDSASLLHAFEKERQRHQLGIHIVSANINGNILTIDFSVDGDVPGKGADIFAVLADDAASSNVSRGENRGHTLSHVSVARAIKRVAKLKTSNEQTVQVPLATSDLVSSGRGRHLILFAQTAGFGRVLGVDTKSL